MQATHTEPFRADSIAVTDAPARQAFKVLHIGFIVLPIAAGLDKFTMLLADWPAYLSPAFSSLIPLNAAVFMYVVGIIEIVAGLLVAVRPRIGGYVVAAWLTAIAINLILHPAGYLDIAVRDLGLALGAFALAKLSPVVHTPKTVEDS